MSSINKAILVGRAGKDPNVKSLSSGDKVVSFTLATSESWKDKSSGERKEKTQWHTVVIYNDKLGEIAEKYVRKGSLVGVEGAIETRKYQAQDGSDRYVTEIVLQRFRGDLTLLGSKGDGDGGERPRDDAGGAQRGAPKRPAEEYDDNQDIPF